MFLWLNLFSTDMIPHKASPEVFYNQQCFLHVTKSFITKIPDLVCLKSAPLSDFLAWLNCWLLFFCSKPAQRSLSSARPCTVLHGEPSKTTAEETVTIVQYLANVLANNVTQNQIIQASMHNAYSY